MADASNAENESTETEVQEEDGTSSCTTGHRKVDTGHGVSAQIKTSTEQVPMHCRNGYSTHFPCGVEKKLSSVSREGQCQAKGCQPGSELNGPPHPDIPNVPPTFPNGPTYARSAFSLNAAPPASDSAYSKLYSSERGGVRVNGRGLHSLSDGELVNNQCQHAAGARPKQLNRHAREIRTPDSAARAQLKSDVENVQANGLADSSSRLSSCLTSGQARCVQDLPQLPQAQDVADGNLSDDGGIEDCDDVRDLPPPPREDDLVDEGAVCDFDRNVLPDEFLSEENSDFPEDSVPFLVDGTNDMSKYSSDHSRLRSFQDSLYFHSSRFNGNVGNEEMLAWNGAVGGSRQNGNLVDQDSEDIGDFIDTDLPNVSGPLLSSSGDSASLSSINGDFMEPVPVLLSTNCMPSKAENDLSGESGKDFKSHRPCSTVQLQTFPNDASMRKSYSSPNSIGREFGNFDVRQHLASSERVLSNSSESENEYECGDEALPDSRRSMLREGAGVAEPALSFSAQDQRGCEHFGAGGDLDVAFHFDRACCVQENDLPMASCVSRPALADPRFSCCCQHRSQPHSGQDDAGACALPPAVNNLSRLNSASRPGGEGMANGLGVAPSSNFINDKSNCQQKVFDKFPVMDDKLNGACGSGVGGPESCHGDTVGSYPAPSAPGSVCAGGAPGNASSLEQCVAGSLGVNVETFTAPTAQPHPDRQQVAESRSGASIPLSGEDFYGLRSSGECCVIHTSSCKVGKARDKKHKLNQNVCHPMQKGMKAEFFVERIMIWSEYEAYLLQVKQIGMSACGQTAVLNLLKAFDLSAKKDDVCGAIQVNLRKEKASVAEYLASRAVAGTTAHELLSGVEKLTDGEIRGRFFRLWPPRNVQLLSWLSIWMKQGAVPIATLNLQQGVKNQQIPDAWHHQMVYGVGPRGVYLTNPLEIVPEETMMTQLTSDSVLMVRRQDIVSRFQATASLAPLMRHSDTRWATMNVLGQVINVLREHNMPSVQGYRAQLTSHVQIPAVYEAGVTLYCRHNTPQWRALTSSPDLPLLPSTKQTPTQL